jgi:L-lactate dehydrogenase (cytochrome)
LLAPDDFARLSRRFPTVEDMRAAARRRIPRFAYDFVDGGTGDEVGLRRNRSALDAVTLVPRFGRESRRATLETTVFGTTYAAPFGVAAMGMAGVAWPGADVLIAEAARAANLPYTLATPGSSTIETIGGMTGGNFWFQLYPFAKDDHAYTFDLVRRAEKAGAQVLIATMDTPVPPKRPRDLRNGVSANFRPTLRTYYDAATHPFWAMQLMRAGTPQAVNIPPDAGNMPGTAATDSAVANHFTWDTIKRIRDTWKRPLLIKGILHPDDAVRAVEIGADAVVVSNHGGRGMDAAPATIDALPAIVEAVAGRAGVFFDSGVRSGLDIVRALAVGADFVFVGRPFLFALAAIGAPGPAYVIDMLMSETRSALAHCGAYSPADARAELTWRLAT